MLKVKFIKLNGMKIVVLIKAGYLMADNITQTESEDSEEDCVFFPSDPTQISNAMVKL